MRTFFRSWGPPLLAAAGLVVLVAGTFRAGGLGGEGRDKGTALDKDINTALKEVINKGADLFNVNQDAAGCARLYQGALLAVRPLLREHRNLQKTIDQGLVEADAIGNPTARAFALRKTLDAVRKELGPAAPAGKGKAVKDKVATDKAATDLRPGQDVAPPRDIKPPVTDKAKAETKQTLWQRLGGADKVKAVVHEFVTIAATDPKVDFTRGGKYKVNVNQVEKGLVDFISQATGGPSTYTGKNMKDLHKGMHITNQEFDASAADLVKALKRNNVDPAAAQDLLNIVDTTRNQIVEPPAGGKSGAGTGTKDGKTEKGTKDVRNTPEKIPVPPDKSAEAGRVTGKVTYQGKPLAGASVVLVSADKKRYAAPLGADGTYEFKDVPPGVYKVAVEEPPPERPAGAPGTVPKSPDRPPSIPIPRRYQNAELSGLTLTAQPGVQTHDIALQ
jgi:hemoglobin